MDAVELRGDINMVSRMKILARWNVGRVEEDLVTLVISRIDQDEHSRVHVKGG